VTAGERARRVTAPRTNNNKIQGIPTMRFVTITGNGTIGLIAHARPRLDAATTGA
jgi:hypothetical protein